MTIVSPSGGRPWTFYALSAVFVGYVMFLYGPMACIYLPLGRALMASYHSQ